MMKLTAITMITLMSVSAFAKSKKEVMGVLANCHCSESTIDGSKNLGKVSNSTPTRSERNARLQAYNKCAGLASDSLSITISNCQYIKVIDEKVGKNFKRRVERIKDDEENSMQNDLLSTL
jgi:hypothetical protein